MVDGRRIRRVYANGPFAGRTRVVPRRWMGPEYVLAPPEPGMPLCLATEELASMGEAALVIGQYMVHVTDGMCHYTPLGPQPPTGRALDALRHAIVDDACDRYMAGQAQHQRELDRLTDDELRRQRYDREVRLPHTKEGAA